MHLLTVGLLRETSFLRLVYPNKPPLSRGIFPLLPRTHRAKGGVADALCHLQPQVGAHRPGESIENQVELCRSYLAAHYPGVRPEEVAVYEDEGFSGKDFQRPQFRRMLEDIRRARPEAWCATGWTG